MKFTFKKSPDLKLDFSIVVLDKQYFNSEYSDYLQKQYGIYVTIEDLKKYPSSFQVYHANKNHRIILIDLSEKFTTDAVMQSMLEVLMTERTSLPGKIQIDLIYTDIDFVLAPIVHGLELSTYNLALYQTEKHNTNWLDNEKLEILFITGRTATKTEKDIAIQAQIMAIYQKEVMNLVNAPYNKLNTQHIIQWIQNQGRTNNIKTTVLNKAKIEKTGLHALLAVNRGSENEPAFIIAEYHGNKKKDARTIGLVGKGVTFDTGGLSIKPSTNLHYMKSDMGGAATVLGTIAAIAAMKWPVNVVAITPITDNSVDARSIKPGDVIDSYSGKTIEIIDTDAEGRLILADALAYISRNYEVDHIIDLATLTGSSVRTFGSVCAALFSNDDELADTLYNMGFETGEKVWSLPIWNEYDDEMKSDIADIKNLSTKPVAGAITAAKFLQAFIADHPSWAHLDIAGIAFGDTRFGKMKAATGWGVHLLCAVIRELS